MDEKFLNDIKNFEHLRSAGISEDVIQESKAHSEKYPLFARMQSENKSIVFLEDSVQKPFDWEALKDSLEVKGSQYAIKQSYMSTGPVSSCISNVPSGIEYPGTSKIFKKEN